MRAARANRPPPFLCFSVGGTLKMRSVDAHRGANGMSWTTNPSDEQLLEWYAGILKLCQVPAGEMLLRPHVRDFRRLPFREAKNMLGGTWRSMRNAFSSQF